MVKTLIEGRTVWLRAFDVDDAERIHQCWNDFDVQRYTGLYRPRSLQDIEDWIRWTHTMRNEEQGYFFGIVERATEALVGETVMGIWSRGHRRGSFGIIIWGKTFWDKGLGSETVQLMLQFGFQTLNLVSIMLGVNAFNHRARHVYQKAGYKEIGRVREHVFFNGRYYDLVYMDILATEFHG